MYSGEWDSGEWGTLELWNFLGKKNDRRYRTEQQRVTVVLGNWRSSQNNVV